MDYLKRAGMLGLQTAAAGLLFGVAAAWIGILTGGGETERVAGAIASLYLVLAPLLPGALLLSVWGEMETAGGAPFSAIQGSLVTLLIAGLIGGLLGGAIFFVPAANLTAIFGGMDPVAVGSAVREGVGWGGYGVVAVATVLGAIAVAFWANRRTQARSAST